MEYKFLPEAIKNVLNLREGMEPDFVLRGSGGISGRPGESYLIFVDHVIYLFERDFGTTNFDLIQLDSHEPGLKAELNKEKFSSVLTLGGYVMKFSNFESGSAAMLLDKIQEHQEHSLKNRKVEPTPYLLLMMMLIDLGTRSDDDCKLSPAAESFIANDICGGGRSLFITARALYENDRMDEVFNALTLDAAQKRCMLANMLEMVMRDGDFSGKEQRLIYEAADKLKIDKADFDKVWDVILDKNCLSILTGE